MKKILFFINYLGSGGAQRQIVELAVGFKKRGYDVKFLIYQKEYGDFYYHYLTKRGILIDGVYESNYLKRIWKVRKYLRTHNFDILISFLEVASFISEMAVLPSKKWKLIVGERSADPAKFTSLKLRFFLQCHMLADYVVANSYANINIVRKIAPMISTAKCKVIYNMLDGEKISPKKDFNFLSHDYVNLVVASSHRYLKNLNGLIEGVKLMPIEKRCKLHINWFGSNKFDDSLEKGMQKIEEYDLKEIFSFHNDTLDIYEYMKEADAIGLFSFFEGLPNAICEGLLLAKPVVVTRVSDIPLIIEEDKNGFLCDASTPLTISNALIKLVDSSREKLKEMGERNRLLGLELFNNEKILCEYESLF